MADHPVQDVRDRLADDGLMAAIWDGGVYAEHEGGEGGEAHPVNPEDTPGAYDVGADGVAILKPCGVVSVSSETRLGPGGCFRQIVLRLGGYQRDGYTAIRSGLARARQVLDRTSGGLDDGSGYYIEYLDTPISGSVDDSLIGGTGKRPPSYEAARFRVMVEG